MWKCSICKWLEEKQKKAGVEMKWTDAQLEKAYRDGMKKGRQEQVLKNAEALKDGCTFFTAKGLKEYKEKVAQANRNDFIRELNVRITNRKSSEDGWELPERKIVIAELRMFRDFLKKKWLEEKQKVKK